MDEINQKVNTIKEKIKCPYPIASQIVNNLYDLLTKKEYKSLSDSEFYDIVGKTFILNPEYFMKNIYFKLKRKIHGKVNGKEMDKYIYENFSLYADEQILYESEGKITQIEPKKEVKTSVDGMLYVTNLRIIAQGTLSASGGGYWDGYVKRYYQRKDNKTGIIDSSADQELPCYGYQFKIKNLQGLRKEKKGVRYVVILNDFENIGADSKVLNKLMRIISITLPYTKEALSLKLNKLYDILCKNIKHPQLNIVEIRADPSRSIKNLKSMLNKIADSDYLAIVREMYNLDPEFFMKSIYPKMKSWKLPSFLIEFLRKEGGNIQ